MPDNMPLKGLRQLTGGETPLADSSQGPLVSPGISRGATMPGEEMIMQEEQAVGSADDFYGGAWRELANILYENALKGR